MLGLFLYRDDAHELDIEARGGLLSYSVQPYDLPGHCQTVDLLLHGDHTTHIIEWHREHVLFQSIHGHGAQSEEKRISSFCHEDSPNGPLSVHMNLWVYAGSPAHEIEVTVSDYAVE
jgi:hypothetical protein